jgi:hypothetical protein
LILLYITPLLFIITPLLLLRTLLHIIDIITTLHYYYYYYTYIITPCHYIRHRCHITPLPLRHYTLLLLRHIDIIDAITPLLLTLLLRHYAIIIT